MESDHLIHTQKLNKHIRFHCKKTKQFVCSITSLHWWHISAVTKNKHEMALKTLWFLDCVTPLCGSLVDYLSLQRFVTHISVLSPLL